MSKRGGPWNDGHRAWQRLTAWHASSASKSDATTGDAALEAMADIGALRRLLDQAELAAVRIARRHNKSWAEIATQLGITRQSAWERWRDLDAGTTTADDSITTTTTSPVEPVPTVEIVSSVFETVSADMTDELLTELSTRHARAHRRHAKVMVPNVIGMSWDDARTTLAHKGLIGTSHDGDAPELAAMGWPNVVVTDQIPEAGAKVPHGTQIRLWLEPGGGSAGVREPRRPSPAPKSGYEWREEPSDEAVG